MNETVRSARGLSGAGILLLVALAIAGLLRAWHIQDLTRTESGEILFFEPVVDAEEYDLEAQRHARGEAWQVPVHGPLYPLLLGSCYRAFGRDLDLARWMQWALGLASIALLFFVARGWIGELPASAACVSLALYRPALLFNAELYSEGLGVFLIIAALYWMQRCWRTGGFFAAAGCGFCLGLLALTRTNLLIALPMAAVALGCAGSTSIPRRLGVALLALVCGALPIFFVARANHAASGEWIAIQAQGGLALYMANHPGSNGTPDVRPGPEFDALRRLARRETKERGPSAESAYWQARVWNFATEDPWSFGALLLRKAWHCFSAVEIPSSYQPEAQREHSRIARVALPGFETLFPLALAGCVAGAWRGPSRRIVLVGIALIAAALIFGFSAGRYRYQLAPFLALSAGAAIAPLAARSRAAWIAAAVGVVLVLTAPHFKAESVRWDAEADALRSVAWIRHAEKAPTTAGKQDALRQAWLSIERGLARAPEDPRLWFTSGFLQMHGDDGTLGGAGANYDDALARTTRAIELRPDYVDALRNRAALWIEFSRADLAMIDLQRVVDEMPWSDADRRRLAETRWSAGGGK